MSLFDTIKSQLGGILAAEEAGAKGAASSSHDPHAMLDSVVGMISEHGGLGGLLEKFKAGGLEDTVASWVGSGDNQAVSGEQIQSALGNDAVTQIASKLGIDPAKASALLAQYVPMVINHLTPNGKVEAESWMDQGLNLLKSQFSAPREPEA